MKVCWTDESYEALKGIREFIARDSDYYACRTVERILSREIQIGTFPRSGRKVPEYDDSNIREVFEGDYRIIYKIRSDSIDVLTVVHGAMQIDK